MHARVTTAKLKPGMREKIVRFREEIDVDMRDFKGLKHWLSLISEDGELVVIAVYDKVSSMEAAAPAARRIWEPALSMAEGPPLIKTYEVTRFDTM